MLETTQYNYKELSKMYKEQTQLGYSKMLPQIALGQSQSFIINSCKFENEVLKSDIPVLIDFWAAWCGPCRMMSSVVAELAEEYEGKAKICKVNVDEEPELASAFKVMSIPMFAVIKNGQVTDSLIGARPKEDLEVLIK